MYNLKYKKSKNYLFKMRKTKKVTSNEIFPNKAPNLSKIGSKITKGNIKDKWKISKTYKSLITS